MDRRFFLKSGGIALASIGAGLAAPAFLQNAVLAQGRASGKRKIIVTIFQRGAVDGLNMVVPYGESNYYNLRRTIAIPKPNGGKEAALNLDGFFGLHPSLAAFQPLWNDKKLAIIHASGSPANTRSHFDAQDYMEAGTPGRKSTPDGWLNRVVQGLPAKGSSPFRAVSLTNNLPRSLYGKAPAVSMTNIANFDIRAGNVSQSAKGGFEAIYDQTAKDALGQTGQETFEAINFLKQANPAQYKPENGAVYPAAPLGNNLRQIAQLIKANIGLEAAFTDMGGWDTHSNEGGARGQLANLLTSFGNSIAAFVKDLGPRMDDVVIVTMSEFGRTARENGTRGTDHGHANAMFVIGHHVKGGQVYGQWPGLDNAKLYEGRDLAITTDFRDVLGEVAQKHMGVNHSAALFPNYTAGAANFKGFLG
jgi:uncharacterized protein (DUF1501 family)